MATEQTVKSDNIVRDKAKSSISDLWKKEDYWAIWLGFLVILIGYIYFVVGYQDDYIQKMTSYQETIKVEEAKPFETLALLEAQAGIKALQVKNEAGPKRFLAVFKTPNKWTDNPITSVYLSQASADAMNADKIESVQAMKAQATALYAAAMDAQNAAMNANYNDATLNATAQDAVIAWSDANAAASKASASLAKPYNLIPNLLLAAVIFGAAFSLGGIFIGYDIKKFFPAFVAIFIFTIGASILGKQTTMGGYGLNTEVWAIILGMLVANTIGTPRWITPGVQVEYFIKTGLVCLGAEVLFGKLLAIGIPGIFVTWVVTPIVLCTTYIFGQKVLKMESKTLNITISADMSVCGTSAAIAAASACGAKKEELTLAVGLSLTFTAIMMIVIPTIANFLGFPEVLAGAWIGGTVDSTGAVAAAGALLGPTAMQVAATIKMIQNILIGVTSFFIAIYWATKVDNVGGQKVSAMEIWHRFPKFVLGFLVASVLSSLLLEGLENVNGLNLSSALFSNGLLTFSKAIKGWCFALAFLSIGLATDFRVLAHYFKGGKPVILYVCGQTFNLCLTLLMAYIMFYLVFPEITASL